MWNYRVVKKGGVFAIHDVYYEDGKPSMVTEENVSLMECTFKDLFKTFLLMEKAFEKPVLNYEDFGGENV